MEPTPSCGSELIRTLRPIAPFYGLAGVLDRFGRGDLPLRWLVGRLPTFNEELFLGTGLEGF